MGPFICRAEFLLLKKKPFRLMTAGLFLFNNIFQPKAYGGQQAQTERNRVVLR